MVVAERQCVSERIGRSHLRLLDADTDDIGIRLNDARFELLWRHAPLYPISAAPQVSVGLRPNVSLSADIATARLLNELDAVLRRVLDARVDWEPIIVKLIVALNDHLALAEGSLGVSVDAVQGAKARGATRFAFALQADAASDDNSEPIGAADLIGSVAHARALKLAAQYCGYYGHDAVQIKNRLYVLGGAHQKTPSGTPPPPPMLRVFDLITRKWSEPPISVGHMHHPRVVRLGDKLFALGGEMLQGTTLLGFALRVISLTENRCYVRKLSVMPALCGRFTATPIGSGPTADVWIVGGRTTGSAVVALLDTKEESLRIVHLAGLETMPSLAGHSAVRVGRFIVLHGGLLDNEISNSTYCIDTERMSISLIPIASEGSVPRHRTDHCAVVVGGVMVVVGGRSYANSNPLAVDIFDLRTQVWTTRGLFGPSPAFASMSATVVGSTVLLLGGRAHSLYAASKDEYTYNTDALLLDIGAKPNVPPSNLAQYYGTLRHSNAGDIELRVGDRTFRVHSVIAYARCRALLAVADGSADVAPLAKVVGGLDVILDYLYTDVRPWADSSKLAQNSAVWSQQRTQFRDAVRCAQLLGLDALAREIDAAVSATDVRVERAAKGRFVDVPSVAENESSSALVPLGRALQKLFDTPELREATADFVFVVGGEQIRVHSEALQRFAFFRTLMSSGMQEARDARMIVPSDVEASVFRAFLRFVYSDRLVCEPDAALDLLALGTQYNVEGLRLSASSLVQSYFDFSDLDNVLHLFEASITYSEPVLRRLCVGVLRADFEFAAVKEAAAQHLSAPAQQELRKLMLKSLTGDNGDVRS